MTTPTTMPTMAPVSMLLLLESRLMRWPGQIGRGVVGAIVIVIGWLAWYLAIDLRWERLNSVECRDGRVGRQWRSDQLGSSSITKYSVDENIACLRAATALISNHSSVKRIVFSQRDYR